MMVVNLTFGYSEYNQQSDKYKKLIDQMMINETLYTKRGFKIMVDKKVFKEGLLSYMIKKKDSIFLYFLMSNMYKKEIKKMLKKYNDMSYIKLLNRKNSLNSILK